MRTVFTKRQVALIGNHFRWHYYRDHYESECEYCRVDRFSDAALLYTAARPFPDETKRDVFERTRGSRAAELARTIISLSSQIKLAPISVPPVLYRGASGDDPRRALGLSWTSELSVAAHFAMAFPTVRATAKSTKQLERRAHDPAIYRLDNPTGVIMEIPRNVITACVLGAVESEYLVDVRDQNPVRMDLSPADLRRLQEQEIERRKRPIAA